MHIILGGTCILLLDEIKRKGGDIEMRKVEGSLTKKEEDWFVTAKKWILNDPKELLDMLLNYKKEEQNPRLIEMLRVKILPNPDFTLERAKTCSLAIRYIFSWVQAMYDFHNVFLQTQPLRDKLMAMT